MKKKILMLVFALVLLVGGIVTLVVLLPDDKTNDDETPIDEVDLEQLDKPLNLQIDGFSLSWDQVDNASSYMVYVDQNEYLVDSNYYDLRNIVKEGSTISVKAIGSDNYKNSMKSLELIFRSIINNDEILVIKQDLTTVINKYLEVTTDISNLVEQTAKLMYLNGLSSSDTKIILKEIDSLLKSNHDIVKIDKLSCINKILDNLIKIINYDINEYATISGLFSFFELFCNVYKENNTKLQIELFDTEYFDKKEILSNFDSLAKYLNSLKTFDIQNVTSLLHYYKVYSQQIDNLFNTLEKSDIDNVNIVYTDILSLKTVLLDLLLNEMPNLKEFEGFKKVFFNVYNIVIDGYLEDNLTSLEIESYFNNIYTMNEYYLSFLDALEDSDYKVIVTRALSFYKSFSEEDKQNFKDVLSLVDLDSENNILEIIKKHFKIVFGQYDFELDDTFKENIQIMLEKDNFVEFVKDIIEYLELEKYISSNDDLFDLIVEYILNLVPDRLQDLDAFYDYIYNILNNFDYSNYVKIDLSKFLSEEDFDIIIEYLIDFILGKIDYDVLFDEIVSSMNFEEALHIDFQLFIDDFIEELKIETFDLANFLEQIFSLDEFSLEQILTIMNINAIIDLDLEGFVDNLFNIMDISIEREITNGRLEEFIDGIFTEILATINKLDKYYSLLEFFKNMEDQEYTEEDIDKIYNGETIDFMSLFVLLDHLNIKYAKFQIKHNPIYDNGLEVDVNSLEENLYSFMIYLYFGKHSYAGEDVTVDTIQVIEKLIEINKDYQTMMDILNHYNLLLEAIKENADWFTLKDLYEDEDEFNELILNTNKEVDYLYHNIKYLLDSLPFEEMINLNYSVISLVESYGYKETSDELKSLATLIDNSYDDFIVSIDSAYNEYIIKEKVVVDLYSNIHVLFDPIEDFVLEIQDIYFVDGKLREDAEVIDIVNYIFRKQETINSFYKKDEILKIGADLNTLFGNQVVDFNDLSLEAIFYGDFIYNRLNAYNAASTISDLAVIIIDIVDNVKELISLFDEITFVLDDSTINYDEKQIRYDALYDEILDKYNNIKDTSMRFVTRLDTFMLKGIEELGSENIEYLNRKEEFLFESEFEDIFKFLDEIILSFEIDLPEESDFNLTDYIIELLKEVI